jgi:hypothetical protein
MNPKLIELAEQRAALVARAETQRAELSRVLASWAGPLGVVDRGWAATRYLGSNPIALRPWRFVKWLPPGWIMWRIVRMGLGAKGILRGW